jgi:hypothetical protein
MAPSERAQMKATQISPVNPQIGIIRDYVWGVVSYTAIQITQMRIR